VDLNCTLGLAGHFDQMELKFDRRKNTSKIGICDVLTITFGFANAAESVRHARIRFVYCPTVDELDEIAAEISPICCEVSTGD
jgi:hypothetical protein